MANEPEQLQRSGGDTPGRGHKPFASLKSVLGAEPAPAGLGPVPARPAPANPIAGRITVRRERAGRGGKTVTLAEGPGLAGRNIEALAGDAAKALGTGARVESGALVVQGDQADRLVAWLGARGFGSVTRGN